MERNFPTNPLLEELFGKNHPIALGWNILVQSYDSGDKFQSNGEESLFERPDEAKERDPYHKGVGRILMIGDACFKAPQFKDWSILPEVGDYVELKKYEGIVKVYHGKNGDLIRCQWLKEFHLFDIIPDPAITGHHHFIGG